MSDNPFRQERPLTAPLKHHVYCIISHSAEQEQLQRSLTEQECTVRSFPSCAALAGNRAGDAPDVIVYHTGDQPLSVATVLDLAYLAREFPDTSLVALGPEVGDEEKKQLISMGCSGYVTYGSLPGDQGIVRFLGGHQEKLTARESEHYTSKLSAWLIDELISVKIRQESRSAETDDQAVGQPQGVQAQGKPVVLEKLVAGFAHELRNPLTAIKGYVAVLKKHMPAGENYRLISALAGLDEALQHLQSVITTFVDLSREKEEALTAVALDEVVTQSFALAWLQIATQDIRTEVDIPTDIPPVKGNRGQLTQVFLNLIINAIHAMDKGGRVTVSARVVDHGRYLQIRVRDTGRGIPEEHLSNIFRPFYTTKGNGKGMGLGLAISYGIIQRHQGFIDVESIVGEGTTFVIKLPTVYNS